MTGGKVNAPNKVDMSETSLDYKIQLMNGTGNSFAITSFMSQSSALEFHKLFSINERTEFVKKICKLLKVDGFILLTEADEKTNDYKWMFYNNDGSDAEMCGNAARCVGHFTFKNHVAGNEQQFESIAGIIEVIVKNESLVTVKMPPISGSKMNLSYEFENQHYKFNFINTGVPHSVVRISSIDQHKSYKAFATQLRNDQQNHNDGSNITFYSVVSESKINSISFERGVEGFTQACGTGAVAAALSHSAITGEKIIEVQMPGGTVKVDFSADKPYLVGPIEYGKAYFPEDLQTLWMNSYTV